MLRRIDILRACYVAQSESPNLEKMQRLRMLEISVELSCSEILEVNGHRQNNPFNDVMRALATAPPTIKYLVLNLEINHPDELPNFMHVFLDEFGS
ncbi:hypothetical protein B0H16DRAFT_1747933 [Mycena metata]|uniref:Uncharacterized protein n=1 Tax=Mycena metata TaxID=1033252 RepID=A0AAD7GR65_9AGAR|nr:hypothetical protein B0H16DRAFT_1747933 [Mycena metata]